MPQTMYRDRSESLRSLRRANPQGQLRDLNRLLGQVHAEEVVIENQVGNRVFELGDIGSGHSGARQAVNDGLVVGVDGVVGADQERA